MPSAPRLLTRLAPPGRRRRPWRWVAAEPPAFSVVVPIPAMGGVKIFTRRAQVSPAGAPVVVLVHGLGMSGLTFAPLIRELAPDAEVWAPDLPGFGRSSRPHHALDLGELAECLAEWLERTGIRPDAFVGHSLGAQVVAQLELQRPGTVPAAVFVGPTRDPQARSVLHQTWRLARDATREPWALVPLAARDYLTATPARMVRTMRSAMDTRGLERARALDLPVLVIRGERDVVAPEQWGQDLVAALPQGELAQVPGAAHATTFSHPVEVAALVIAHARRHRR